MCLVSLDYSTTCTGYAVFSLEKKLIKKGIIKPKGKSKLPSLEGTLARLELMADEIVKLIEEVCPTSIIIEEVNQGKARLTQKTLCGGHFILFLKLKRYLDKIQLRDSDGAAGWRTQLKLFLTTQDKKNNLQAKKANKKIARGLPKFPIITRKDLACRYVNERFGLQLDCQQRETDGDVADAIGLGIAELDRRSRGD